MKVGDTFQIFDLSGTKKTFFLQLQFTSRSLDFDFCFPREKGKYIEDGEKTRPDGIYKAREIYNFAVLYLFSCRMYKKVIQISHTPNTSLENIRGGNFFLKPK